MYPVLLDLGFIRIHSYGFFFALAYIVAVSFGLYRRKRFGISSDNVIDIAIYIMIGSVIGAKILSLIVDFREILQNGISFDMIRSGFVFLGGLGGGIAAGVLYVYRNKAGFLKYMDFVAPILPLSHATGRLGCFFNGCCYGKVTDSCLGVVFPALGDSLPRIPTQMIEAVFLVFLTVLILFLEKKKILENNRFPFYILSYSIFRFIIEFYRGDDIRGFLAGVSTSQWVSLIFGLLCIIVMIMVKKGKIR